MLMGKKKEPLLSLLKTIYPEKSKDELYAGILCGEVIVDGSVIKNPHTPTDILSRVVFKAGKKFVSRGGEKLDYIINNWDVKVKGKVALDAGSSTGGFTDCLLKHGACTVYAVDVGYNQLNFRLRNNPHVEVMERTNIMALSKDNFKILPDFAVMDLSFRSVRKAAYHTLTLLKGGGLICLIKPQFEYFNPQYDFNGIVKTKEEVFGILKSLISDLKNEGVEVLRIDKSPILGRKGNREYFFELSLSKAESNRFAGTGLTAGLESALTRIVLE